MGAKKAKRRKGNYDPVDVEDGPRWVDGKTKTLVAEDSPILFFDGVCNLCNKTVQFIIRNDKRKIFRFAPLQSERGEELLSRIEREQGKRPESVILLYKDKYYMRSSAVLKVAGLLGGRMLLLMSGYIFPAFIRDAIYDAVAGRRYKWFGRQDECMIPTPELKARFLS